MASTYSEAIREALFSSEQTESVERIKDAVSDALIESDPTARVFRTSHFNNTYAPDLILEWPLDNKQAPRHVFLRPTQIPEILADDFESLGSRQTIFVHLDELLPSSAKSDELAGEAREQQALVTEIQSMERLNERRSSAGVGLLAASVVRAGVGLLEKDVAERSATRVEHGFEAAQSLDAEGTAMAVEEIERALLPGESARMTNVLQAVWVGSGGEAASFPGILSDLSGGLSGDALSFLLQFEVVADDQFWERLARSIDMKTLQSLASFGALPAFQRLIRAALPRLRGKACAVRKFEGQFLEDQGSFEWSVEGGALALQGFGYRAWAAERRSDLPVGDASVDGPPLSTLLLRARTAEIELLHFEATNGVRNLRYGSESPSDVTGDEGVAFVTDALGGDARVRNAASRFGSGQHFDLNFETLTAGGRTAARPAVRDVIWTSICLMVDLPPAALRSLRLVLLPEEDHEALRADGAGQLES